MAHVRILTFASIAESSNSIFSPSINFFNFGTNVSKSLAFIAFNISNFPPNSYCSTRKRVKVYVFPKCANLTCVDDLSPRNDFRLASQSSNTTLAGRAQRRSGYIPIELYVPIQTYFYVQIGLFSYLFTSFSYSSHLRIKLLG